MVDPRRLLVLPAIAAAGGITGASRVLRLSPSAVSQQLAALERETGTVLVDRTGPHAVLTPAGRMLAERAQQVQEAVTGAEHDLAALTGHVSGVVTVAAYATIASRVVAPALGELGADQPGITVTLVIESVEPAMLARLRAGGADLAIVEEWRPSGRAEMPPAPGLDGLRHWEVPAGTRSVPLLRDPYRIVVPATSPEPATAADLLPGPWIGGPAGSTVRRALDLIGETAGVAAVVQHECCEFPGVLNLVAAGLGAAIVPDLGLVSVPPGVRVTGLGDAGERRLHAVCLDRPGRLRPAVATVLETLVAATRGRADGRPRRQGQPAAESTQRRTASSLGISTQASR